MDLSTVTHPRVSYWLWFYNQQALSAPRTSTVTTLLSNDGGVSWVTVSVMDRARAPWVRIEFKVEDYIPAPSSAVRVRFVAENRFSDPVEVLIDDFKIFAGPSGGSLAIARREQMQATRASALSDIRVRWGVARSGAWTFSLSRPSLVRASLFDVQGRLVRTLHDGALAAGDHVIGWDGRRSGGAAAASGVYWLRVQSEGDVRTSKFILTR